MPEATSSVGEQQLLVSQLRSSIADDEDTLHATADSAGDKIAGLRTRIKERLKDARAGWAEAEATLTTKTRAAARATDDYVHESPWTAVGVAAAVGLLVGLIIGRR